MSDERSRWLVSGPLVVDLADEQAALDGEPLQLGTKSFGVLKTLMSSPQRLVTKDDLFAAVWPEVTVSDASLTTAVRELRRALGDGRGVAAWIQTVRGRGYRFRRPVDTGRRATSDTLKPDASEEGARMSIAVLPFADMSEQGDQAYFSDGVAEEILNALAKAPGFRVVGRTSSFAFRNPPLGIREIGAKLNAAYLLEGAVRRDETRVRVSARLSSAEDGFQIWSETFDRPLAGIFDLQDEVAREIARALQIVLASGPAGRLAKRMTADGEAYDLFLRGRALVDIRDGEATLAQAVRLLERATDIDPSFAEAWAELARANNTLPQYTLTPDGDVYLDRAQAAASRALALDPNLARAHLAASGIDSRRFGLGTPYPRLTKALELDPDDADALGAFSYWHCIIGHCRTAREIGARAVRRDPLNATNLWVLALACVNTGALDEAEDLLSRSADLGFLTAHMWRHHVAGLRGDRRTARDLLAVAMKPFDEMYLVETGLPAFSEVFADAAHLGAETAASSVRTAMKDCLSRNGAILNAQRLGILLYVQDYGFFCDLYGSKTYSGDTFTLCMFWDGGHVAKGLRGHPRFPELVRTVDLQSVWNTHGAPDVGLLG